MVDIVNTITIELAYATPAKQILLELQMPAGSTVLEAINKSNILELHSEIKLESGVGIWSKACSIDAIIKKGDRIEIYRPLNLSPLEARRLRAQTMAKKA